MKSILRVVILTFTTMFVTSAAAAEEAKCPANLEPIVRVPPEYPTSPTLGDLNGWVVVEFVVSEDGSTKSAVVTESSSLRR